MPIKTYQQSMGLGARKQTNITTANTTQLLRLQKRNPELFSPSILTENDGGQYGSGSPFPANVYITGRDLSGSFETDANSVFATWMLAMGLGVTPAPTGSGPYVYTHTFPDFASGVNVDPPYFSIVSKAGAAEDSLFTGCAVNGFNITVNGGLGLQNSTMRAEIIGTGTRTSASAITLPVLQSVTNEAIPGGTLTVTIGGTNYVATCRTRSLSFTVNNNIAPLFCPGSGYSTAGNPNSGQVAGQLIRGIPTVQLEMLVEARDSNELTLLEAQTEVIVVIGLNRTIPAAYGMTITLHRAVIASRASAEDNGDQCWRITIEGLFHSTNGLLTATSSTSVNNIGQA